MSDAEVLEIPFKEAIAEGPYTHAFSYDNTRFPYADAEEKAHKRVELARKIRDEVVRNRGKMFFKLTAGQRAGTIGIIELADDNCTVTRTREDAEYPLLSNNHEPVRAVDVPSEYRWRAAKGEGQWQVLGEIAQKGRRWTRNGTGRQYELLVDGKGSVALFDYDDPFVDSARPVMLLGYKGPTVWAFSRRGVSTDKGFTIKDRYGRVVKKGDVVIASMRPSGTQVVGKITNITAKRSIKLKHIGAAEETNLVAIRDDQVILLDDELQRVLMFKKLQTL